MFSVSCGIQFPPKLERRHGNEEMIYHLRKTREKYVGVESMKTKQNEITSTEKKTIFV